MSRLVFSRRSTCRALINGAKVGIPVSIVVLDAGAHLNAFRRMDGAVLASIEIAIRKGDGSALPIKQRVSPGILQA